MPVKRKLTRKKSKTLPLRQWSQKAKKMSGGFFFLIPLLISAGLSIGAATATASVIGAAAGGVATATGAYVATKALKAIGGSKCRPKLTHRRIGHRLS